MEMPSVDFGALKDKSVIITGGASGLGKAVAAKFAASGAYVTLADLQEEAGQAVVKQLQADGGRAQFVRCNTTDWDSSVAAFKAAVNFSPHKTLDVAALFAGIVGEGKSLVQAVQEAAPPSLEHDPAAPTDQKVIQVNLVGVYLSAYLALHYMQLKPSDGSAAADGGGKKSLVLVASMAGYVDYANTVYNASKFGVRAVFKSIRASVAEIGVRVNLLAPWFIDTPMTSSIKEEMRRRGLAEGKGFTFAPMEHLVGAAGHCATNDNVNGRAFAVMPEGFFDLEDDIEKGFAGPKTGELVMKRVAAGDQII